VVFDFDGTLCSHRERFTELRPDIRKALELLLRNNVLVGIATGRGKSIKKQVRQSVASRYWENIWVGYYNGGDIASLADDGHPVISTGCHPVIAKLQSCFEQDEVVTQLASVTTRPCQITLEPKGVLHPGDLWRHALRVTDHCKAAAKVLFSTHSVDIVPVEVRKTDLVHRMEPLIGLNGGSVLCMGDLGQYPGNDFELLAEPYSLSCDRVSEDARTCWNLAPGGFKGVQATLYYLSHLKVHKSGLKLKLPVSGGDNEA